MTATVPSQKTPELRLTPLTLAEFHQLAYSIDTDHGGAWTEVIKSNSRGGENLARAHLVYRFSGERKNVTSPETAFDSASVVQRQLDAYNAHNLEALLETYAEDAQQFEHPAKLLASGIAQLRERFTARFAEPNLHAQLLNRIVIGNTVIDHELVTRTFPEGPGTIELVATYEVLNGKIAKAWFIAGAKTIKSVVTE